MKKIRKLLCACMLAFATLCMVACVPDTVEEAKKKMEEEGYRVVITKEKEEDYGLLAKLQITSKSDPTNITFAYYFDTIADAKRYFGEEEDLSDDMVMRRHDRWVLLGNKKTIWDFRK